MCRYCMANATVVIIFSHSLSHSNHSNHILKRVLSRDKIDGAFFVFFVNSTFTKKVPFFCFLYACVLFGVTTKNGCFFCFYEFKLDWNVITQFGLSFYVGNFEIQTQNTKSTKHKWLRNFKVQNTSNIQNHIHIKTYALKTACICFILHAHLRVACTFGERVRGGGGGVSQMGSL